MKDDEANSFERIMLAAEIVNPNAFADNSDMKKHSFYY